MAKAIRIYMELDGSAGQRGSAARVAVAARLQRGSAAARVGPR